MMPVKHHIAHVQTFFLLLVLTFASSSALFCGAFEYIFCFDSNPVIRMPVTHNSTVPLVYDRDVRGSCSVFHQ